MTSNEIKKALECCTDKGCLGCPYYCANATCIDKMFKDILAYINELEAENKALHKLIENIKSKTLSEACSKFAGHSDYHGDVILSKLMCMAEGKEVDVAIPLDKNKIISDAIKEFAARLKATYPSREDTRCTLDDCYTLDIIDTLVKEMVGEKNG